MSNKINEQMVLNYSNPANNYGSNNLRDLILVLHESGKNHETIYNVLNMIGIEKQKAYEAIEMYIPKKIEIKMEIKETSKTEIAEDMTMMIAPKGKQKDRSKKVVEQALDLPGRVSLIKAIAESLPVNYQTSAIKTIAEKYFQLSSTPGNIHSVIARNLVAELNQYSWVDKITNVVNELTNAFNENAVSITLNEAYNRIKNAANNGYYIKAISEMEDMLELTESELREKGAYRLSAHSWIPDIKAVIGQINYVNKDLSEDTTHTVTKKFSPVIEHDNGFVFNLHGSSYVVKNNEITKIDQRQLAAQYLTLIAVEENFKFSDNKMTFHKGKHTYEIHLNEGNKTVTVDGRELLFKESVQLKNLLMSTAHFGINEMHTMDMVVAAYENADKFVELDFVQSIQPRNAKGVVANIMRIGENVYINKINTSMNVNEFTKAENATKAVQIIKEFVGYDISTTVEDLLAEDVIATRALNIKKNDILDKITFLKEQKSSLSTHELTNPYLQEANKLITEEIEKFQKEFNSML